MYVNKTKKEENDRQGLSAFYITMHRRCLDIFPDPATNKRSIPEFLCNKVSKEKLKKPTALSIIVLKTNNRVAVLNQS